MRFRTRAFLCCFVPFALLLAGSFWMIQRLVQSTVRDGLRTSMRENHQAVERLRSKSDLQSSRFLKVAGENAELKAGVQLMLQYPANRDARRTLEEQLGDLCERMGFDLLMVLGPPAPGDIAGSDKHSGTLVGVLRRNGRIGPLDDASATASANNVPGRLWMLDGVEYQIASVPINQADENIGSLSVGEVFDLSEFTTPTVLFHNGRVMASSLAGIGFGDVQSALGRCAPTLECDIQLRGENYMSLPVQTDSSADGFVLRSLQNVDAAVGPVRQLLRRVFLSVAFGAALVALVFSMASAGSIVRPIAKVIERLKESERTGDLAEFPANISPVREIRALSESFNRAAASIREGRENLNDAYVDFVQSLASALDARDRYTAGHSDRVSEFSQAVARHMGLPAETVERVRTGALLHDIGKIGVADSLLQKPGKLTPAEFAIVKTHPEIGRRILAGVEGFGPFLPAVELHHENWDGTGYPYGQSGASTPIEARIIHVADAYDAMTSDRPYRPGMPREEAIAILRECAGTQFDPEIVEVLTRMLGDGGDSNHAVEPKLGEMTTMEVA